MRNHVMLCPNEETLSLHIVIALAICVPVIAVYHPATGKFVALSLLQVTAFGTSEQLSLLLVTSLGILESLLFLEVTL